MKKHVNLPMENEKFVNFTNSELMYKISGTCQQCQDIIFTDPEN